MLPSSLSVTGSLGTIGVIGLSDYWIVMKLKMTPRCSPYSLKGTLITLSLSASLLGNLFEKYGRNDAEPLKELAELRLP